MGLECFPTYKEITGIIEDMNKVQRMDQNVTLRIWIALLRKKMASKRWMKFLRVRKAGI